MLKLTISRHTTHRFLLIVIVFIAVRLYNINAPLLEMHSVRQTQTAMVTRNLLQDHFNILMTRIDWKGNEPGYVIVEFPLYQLIVSVLWKLFGAQDALGRLVSLAFGFLAAIYLYKILSKTLSAKEAFWAVAFFAVCPISVFTSQAFMVNMTSLGLALTGMYYALIWIEKKSWPFIILTTIFITLAALVNNTVVIALLVPLGYILWFGRSRSLFFLTGIVFFVLIITASIMSWGFYAAHVNSIYYPEWGASKMIKHYFGLNDIMVRLNPLMYFRIGMYFIYFVTGLHALALMFWGSGTLWKRRDRREFHLVVWWALGAIFYCVVFFNALRGHNYYMLPIVPTISILVGIGFSSFTERFKGKGFFIPISAFVLTYAGWLIFPFIHMHEQDKIAYEIGLSIRQHTQPNDLVLVGVLHTDVASEAYPTILYYAQRKGWNFLTSYNSKVDFSKIEDLRSQGGKYLVLSYGKQKYKPVSKIFPFYKYFGHTVNSNYAEVVEQLKERYKIISEQTDYSLFRL